LIVFRKYKDCKLIRTSISLNNKIIPEVDSFLYLGHRLNYNLDNNLDCIDKFKIVKNSFFSLFNLGLKPNGLNPYLQSFIYKTLCLSKFLYSLEIVSLNKNTLKKLNMEQNTLIRFMIGLHKNCHMSDLLITLKILNIGELITFYKLTFIKNLKKNKICLLIFEYLCENLNSFNMKSLSFARDIKNLQDFFSLNIKDISLNIEEIIKDFKNDIFTFDNDTYQVEVIHLCSLFVVSNYLMRIVIMHK
jgi:hypothetical protein